MYILLGYRNILAGISIIGLHNAIAVIIKDINLVCTGRKSGNDPVLAADIPEDWDNLTSAWEDDASEELDEDPDPIDDFDDPDMDDEDAEDWRGFSCCIAAGFSSVKKQGCRD